MCCFIFSFLKGTNYPIVEWKIREKRDFSWMTLHEEVPRLCDWKKGIISEEKKFQAKSLRKFKYPPPPKYIPKITSYILVVGPSNSPHFGRDWLHSMNAQEGLTFHEFSRGTDLRRLTTSRMTFGQTIDHTGSGIGAVFIRAKPMGTFKFSFLPFPILLGFRLVTLFSRLHFFLVFLPTHFIDPDVQISRASRRSGLKAPTLFSSPGMLARWRLWRLGRDVD